METKKISPSQPAIKWAVINLVASIIITYAIQFLSLDPNSPVKYLGFLPFIAFLLLTQKEYKDQLGGYITFGEAFLSGFLYAVFTGVLLGIFTYLYLAILSPDVFEKSIATAQDQMAGKGLSQEQIDAAMNITRKYGPLFGAIGSIVVYAILGVVLGLIGAAVFKKERSALDVPNYEEPTPLDPVV